MNNKEHERTDSKGRGVGGGEGEGRRREAGKAVATAAGCHPCCHRGVERTTLVE